MERRRFSAGLIGGVLALLDGQVAKGVSAAMSSDAPERIRLIPDKWRLPNVGRLHDGRMFFVDWQLDPTGGATRDFVCTFVFDQDGRLDRHSIELIGERGKYSKGAAEEALQRHLSALGSRGRKAIWVRPFSVAHDGVLFGLVPRRTESGEWRVEFMPGNTLSFYPPWEDGGYDT